jgi:hypothetical protein
MQAIILLMVVLYLLTLAVKFSAAGGDGCKYRLSIEFGHIFFSIDAGGKIYVEILLE